MKKFLLGIDLGTSAVKTAIIDLSGNILNLKKYEYKTNRPHHEWAEQNPSDWWEGIKTCIKDILKESEISSDKIAAIGTCGQAPGLVVINKEGEALMPAWIWQDRRAWREAVYLKNKFSNNELKHYLGCVPKFSSSLTPSRIVWLKNNQKEILDNSYKILQPKEYINFLLTGEFATDINSAFGLINIEKQRYFNSYLKEIGIHSNKLPKLHKIEDIVGQVTPYAAKQTSLNIGTPVINGTIDVWCNIIGSGAVKHNTAVDIAGTSEVIAVVSEEKINPSKAIICSTLIDHLNLCLGPTQSGDGSLSWFLKNIIGEDFPEDYSSQFEIIMNEAEKVPAGSKGIIFLPYLIGERSPIWDEKARGCFIGLTDYHNYIYVLKSVMEGVAYNIRDVLEEAQRATGLIIKEIYASGGGTKISVWNQIKCDVLGIPLIQLKIHETGVLGASIIAAVGLGLFSSYQEATKKMVHREKIFRPDPKNHLIYSKYFTLYRNLYPKLKIFFIKLNTLNQ